MLLETSPNGHKVVTFEEDPAYGFHEQFIARDALGLLTLRYAREPSERLAPAQLANKIDKLQWCTSETKDLPEKKLQNSRLPIKKNELEILKSALENYIESTPSSIRNALSNGPSACNIRALEGHLATNMLLVLDPGQTQLSQKPPFGFKVD